MLTSVDFDTATAEQAERLRNARNQRLARELIRAHRLQQWADRSARFSCWLEGLARRRRARVG